MNQAAAQRAVEADAEMSRVLNEIMHRAAGKPDAIAKLQKAQAAWEAYRDAQGDVLWPFPERTWYGSANPMCVSTVRQQLTAARIKELRAMLSPPEGDACASQWPD
jgi:uncharacterized protein YecT (DUF1311 family)